MTPEILRALRWIKNVQYLAYEYRYPIKAIEQLRLTGLISESLPQRKFVDGAWRDVILLTCRDQ